MDLLYMFIWFTLEVDGRRLWMKEVEEELLHLGWIHSLNRWIELFKLSFDNNNNHLGKNW